jgi:hypothetical protein
MTTDSLLADHEMFLAILGFLFAAAMAIQVAVMRRRAYETRLAQLDQVHTLMENAFDAADILLTAPETPQTIKEFVRERCKSIGERDAALRLAALADRKKEAGFVYSKLPSDLREALRELARRREDLLETLLVFLADYRAATALRWPETAELGQRLLEFQPPKRPSPEVALHKAEERYREVATASSDQLSAAYG